MNSCKKKKSQAAIRHVRKQSSTSSKTVQNHGASLLKNNKMLAVTLEETRRDLLKYKNLFKESVKSVTKAKLARSKIKDAINNFLKAFNEIEFLLDFDDELEYPDERLQIQSCKNFQNVMNPVFEVTDEMLEKTSDVQEINGNQEEIIVEESSNIPNVNQQEDIGKVDSDIQDPGLQTGIIEGKTDEMLEKASVVQEISRNQEEIIVEESSDIPNVNQQEDIGKVDSDTQDPGLQTGVIEDITTKETGVTNYPQENFLQVNNIDSSSCINPSFTAMIPQTDKCTKIPRYKGSSTNKKPPTILGKPKRKIIKQMKAHSQKLLEKEKGESNVTISQRKTFVVKNNAMVIDSESTEDRNNLQDTVHVSEDIPNVAETLNTQEDMFVNKTSKRKIAIQKNNNAALVGSEFTDNGNKFQDTEYNSENITNVVEILDIPINMLIADTNKRKTFVKKNSNTAFGSSDNRSDLLSARYISEDIPNVADTLDVPKDIFTLNTNKRKTFVKKNSNAALASSDNKSDLLSERHISEDIPDVVETLDIPKDTFTSNINKRKTFVIENHNNSNSSASSDNKSDLVLAAKYISEDIPAVVETLDIPKDTFPSNTNKRKTFVKENSNNCNSSASSDNRSDLLAAKYISEDIPAAIETLDIPKDTFTSNTNKRKTFVKKNNNAALISSESIYNPNSLLNEKNMAENVPKVNEISNAPFNVPITKNNKRKTFIKRNKKCIPVDSEYTDNENNIFNTENTFQNEKNVNKALNVPNDMVNLKSNLKDSDCSDKTHSEKIITQNDKSSNATKEIHPEKNERETFVKEIFCQSETFPEKECIPEKTVVTENSEKCKNIDPIENLKTSCCASNKEISIENSKQIQQDVDATISCDKNITPESPSKEIKNKSPNVDRSEAISKNLKSKEDFDIMQQPGIKNVKQNDGVVNKEMMPVDDSSKTEDNDIEFINIITDKISDSRHRKCSKFYYESSESDCESIPTDEVAIIETKCSIKTTPVRRHISNTKNKKFVFDGNKKRKKSLKKKTCSKTMSFKNADNFPVKDSDVYASDTKDDDSNNLNGCKIKKYKNTIVLDNPDNDCNVHSSAFSVSQKFSKNSSKKVKNIQNEPIDGKFCRTKKSKKNSPEEISVDDIISKPKETKKKKLPRKKKEKIPLNGDDGDAISKFKEDEKNLHTIGKNIKLNQAIEIPKNLDFDLPCKKTGENTYLVQAEIHPPPPSLNILDMKGLNKENANLNIDTNRQVAIVLNDVLKSGHVDISKLCEKDLLNCQTLPVKIPFSENSNNVDVDPESTNKKLQNNDAFDAENERPRRRKNVDYKEPSLHRKMRRC